MTVSHKEHPIPAPVKVGETLGNRLSKARGEAGLSMRELSRRSGVSVAHLSRLERDQQDPTVGMLRTIAEALGMELLDLVIDPDVSIRHRVIADTAELTSRELGKIAGVIADLVGEPAPVADGRPAPTRIFQDIGGGAEVGETGKSKTSKTRRTRRRRRS